MFRIIRQLHGGHGGGGGSSVKQSAPGSQAVPTIDNATAEQRAKVRERLGSRRGRNYSNPTQGMAMTDQIKKALLGE